MAASPAGGCAEKVTDAEGVLLPGAHVYFDKPTNRYPHAVLGDDLEWGSLVYIQQGSPADGPYVIEEFELPKDRVFEDLTPRLIDLDGDGLWEVVVVESSATEGAQLAVYGLRDLKLVKLAATPHIGTRFRWLAPIGAADLDGDGFAEIAFIDRPHLAKTLRVWRFQNDKLEPVAAARGLTNHRIGEDFISGGLRDCGDGPELITADAGWRDIIATRLQDGTLEASRVGAYSGQKSFEAALACRPL